MLERATEDRESSFSMDRFLKDRWLVARSMTCEGTQYRGIAGKLVNEVITSDVQALVVKSDLEVKFDQEVSIVEVESPPMGELHSVRGSICVPEKLLVSASAASAAIETDVCETQHVVRSLDASVEYSTTSDFDSAILAWTVETRDVRSAGLSQVLLEERTACERRQR